MARIGIVVASRGDRAQVSTARRGPCEGCSDKGACGQPADAPPSAAETILVDNSLGAKPGDTVEFDLPGHMELKLSLLVWAVPLVCLVFGAAAGNAYHQGIGISADVGTLLGGIGGFALAIALLRRIDRRARHDPNVVPRVQKVLRSATCPGQGPSSDAV